MENTLVTAVMISSSHLREELLALESFSVSAAVARSRQVRTTWGVIDENLLG